MTLSDVHCFFKLQWTNFAFRSIASLNYFLKETKRNCVPFKIICKFLPPSWPSSLSVRLRSMVDRVWFSVRSYQRLKK